MMLLIPCIPSASQLGSLLDYMQYCFMLGSGCHKTIISPHLNDDIFN